MEGDDDDEDVLITDAAQSDEASSFWGFTREEIIFILAITVVSVGVDFSLDIPASLQVAMSMYYNLNQFQFSLFYTCYFLPSMVLNVFGGYIIDKFMGVRISTIVYSIVAALGLVMFVSGGALKLFWLMLLGRFVFGMGSEMSSNVCMSYCTFTYFSRTNVNFMFSLTDNFSYLGTMIVFQLAPYLFTQFSTSHTPYQSLNLVLIICSSTYLVTGCISVWISYMGHNPSSDATADNTSETSHLIPPVSLSDVIRFPPIFWILCIAYCCFMNANFTFETFSQGLFTSDLFKMSVEEASNAVTVMNSVKIVMSIPLSLLVDKIGRNILFVVLSMLLCAASYTLFVITTVHPYIIMGLLGASYALTGSAIWAMFAYPISKHLRGSCYGIVSAVNGFSQSICPIIVGNLIDKFGYMAAMYFFLGNSLVAVLATGITWILDWNSGGILSMTPSQRSERENQFERLCEEEASADQDWNVPLPNSEVTT